jgi:hypothetical protein
MSYCRVPAMAQRLSGLNLRVGEFLVVKYGLDTKGSMNYFIAANARQRTVALVLRGTHVSHDILLDINAMPVSPDADIFPASPAGSKVHKGFYEQFLDYRANITQQIVDSMRMYPKFDLVIIGHSLGASWAYLTAADLQENTSANIAALYTFGQPLTGNQAFVDSLAESIGPDKIIRIVNGNDLVPHIGLSPGGAHPMEPDEHFVKSETGQILTCRGGQDPICSLGISCLQWSWRTHSELAGFSMREELCRMTKTIPSTVYLSEQWPVLLMP